MPFILPKGVRAMNDELYNSFSLLVMSNHRYMNKLFGIALDGPELNPASLLCLMMISMNSGGLSAGKLCEICCFDKALVSRTFKELERSGYIEWCLPKKVHRQPTAPGRVYMNSGR